jgi:D-serine deaminase-like pyridoxal phosphate-dependent protein
MSRPTEDRAIVDAGLKALAFDSGPPLVWDEPAATYERASEERGRLAVGHGPQSRRFILTAWSGSTTNGG